MRMDELIAALEAASPDKTVTVLTLSAPMDVDPLALVSGTRNEDVFCWEQPASGRCFVGVGSAWQETAAGTDRFAHLHRSIRALQATVLTLGEQQSPRLGAGFSFAPDSDWYSLPPGLARLPRLAYVREGDSAFWQVAAPIGPARVTAGQLESQIEEARALAASPPPVPIAVGQIPTPADDPAYRKLVQSGIKSIHRGEFDKVVLARSVDTPATPDLGSLLARLRLQHPEAAVFAVGNGVVFCGATPELLVRWEHDRADGSGTAYSVALAGTAARGETPAEDDRLGAELSHNPKELAEHQFVIDHLVEQFGRTGMRPSASPTDLMKLQRVQHLRTAVLAEGTASDGVMELADLLHPTPAVGGTPDSLALDFIARHEGLDRGWYAGPIGVITLDGEGEFWVALRCALIDHDHTTLFAGAGIVADSDPEAELEETALKLQTLGALIGLM